MGKLIFPPGNSVSQFSPNFSRISLEFPPNSLDFPMISPDSSVSCAVFYLQLHKCTLSVSIRPVLCILYVGLSLKMRIPHYVRRRIINLGNYGEIQRNSGEFWGNQMKSFSFFFTHFPRCEHTFHIHLIPLISQKLVKTPVKKKKGNSQGNVNSPFISFPLQPPPP